MEKYGLKFERTEHGGWLEVGAVLPDGSTAKICNDAVVTKRAALKMHGGTFWGGTFWNGTFEGGTFRGGTFRGGTFRGGTFRGGTFRVSPAIAQRSDGHIFMAHFVDDELRIWAGCRNFSWDEAVAHWNDDHKYGAESQRIIHFLKAQAEANKNAHA